MNDKLDLIIPAAGKSQRFGENKVLYKLDNNKNFLELIRDAYFNFNFIRRAILVTGFEKFRYEIEEWAQKNNFFTVNNPLFESGMFSSIKTGLNEVDDNCAGFIIHPADCPYIKPFIIEDIFSKFISLPETKTILIPSHKRRRGHPPFFKIQNKKIILNNINALSLRDFYTSNSENIYYLEFDDENILRDIDTKNELSNPYAEYSGKVNMGERRMAKGKGRSE